MITGKLPKVTLSPGGLEPAVLKIIEQLNKQAQLPVLVDVYIDHAGIKVDRFTDEVREAMVEYLQERGADIDNIDIDDVTKGNYDELFALAYDYAIARKSGRDDPLDAAYQPGGGMAGAPWNYSVDMFDQIDQQGVVRDNILAAGAIDYIYELGEHMGIFKLADAVVLNWASGAIDVVQGDIVSRLYRYWKLRDQRSSSEERGILYRRVLNKGDTEVLDRMVVNEEHPNLWHNKLVEVADYIDKTDKVPPGTKVSRSRIYQTVRDNQYNLTEFCTGMAHIQARELYAQLQECIAILQDPEILAYFGGNRRKTLWTVIELLSKQEFGASPNIAAIRSLAVDGNTIFKFIADFSSGGAVREEDFDTYLRACEAYILNYSTISDDLSGIDANDEEEEVDSEEEEFAEDDF